MWFVAFNTDGALIEVGVRFLKRGKRENIVKTVYTPTPHTLYITGYRNTIMFNLAPWRHGAPAADDSPSAPECDRPRPLQWIAVRPRVTALQRFDPE